VDVQVQLGKQVCQTGCRWKQQNINRFRGFQVPGVRFKLLPVMRNAQQVEAVHALGMLVNATHTVSGLRNTIAAWLNGVKERSF
jgi:hypothetical protein